MDFVLSISYYPEGTAKCLPQHPDRKQDSHCPIQGRRKSLCGLELWVMTRNNLCLQLPKRVNIWISKSTSTQSQLSPPPPPPYQRLRFPLRGYSCQTQTTEETEFNCVLSMKLHFFQTHMMQLFVNAHRIWSPMPQLAATEACKFKEVCAEC